MNNYKTLRTIVLVFVIAGVAISACGTSSTPPPTATLAPTATPYPTYRGSVKVVSAEGVAEFGTFYMPSGSTGRLVLLTIEYTNTGQDKAEFSPDTVILMNKTASGIVGWGRTPALYRAESTSRIEDLDEEAFLNFVDPQDTKTEVFAWEFPKSYTSFRLYFPEAETIEVSIK